MELTELVEGRIDKIRILDLGALSLKGESPCYGAPQLNGLVDVTRVDAISNGFEHEVVIGDGNEQMFYVTKLPTCSSVFEPNNSVTDRYNKYSEYLEIRESLKVQSVKLDDLIQDSDFDFVKSDLQGSDLCAIKHGSKVFSKALVVEVETEFIEQYRNQPLFSNVEIELRKQGFHFHTFTGYGTRARKPFSPPDLHKGVNQWLWANAVFVSDRDDTRNPQKYIKAAVIMQYMYESYDYVLYFLTKADELSGENLAAQYLDLINGA